MRGVVFGAIVTLSFNLIMTIKFILGGALVLLALIFSIQNAGVVDLKFLGWNFAISLALVIFTALAVGLIGGWALTSALRLKKRVRKESSAPQADRSAEP